MQVRLIKREAREEHIVGEWHSLGEIIAAQQSPLSVVYFPHPLNRMVLMAYLASSGVMCDSSSRTSAALAAGAAGACDLAEGGLHLADRLGGRGRPHPHGRVAVLPRPRPDRPACGTTRSVQLQSCRTVPAPDARAERRLPGGWFLPRPERADRRARRRPRKLLLSAPTSEFGHSGDLVQFLAGSWDLLASLGEGLHVRVCKLR